jgi:hypothetical protein
MGRLDECDRPCPYVRQECTSPLRILLSCKVAEEPLERHTGVDDQPQGRPSSRIRRISSTDKAGNLVSNIATSESDGFMMAFLAGEPLNAETTRKIGGYVRFGLGKDKS